MKSHQRASLLPFVLALLATAASAAPSTIATTRPARATSPEAALRAHFDPRLEQLRAGQVSETARLTSEERGALCAAQDQGSDLLDMRAGGGAGGVLLILAVVLLIVLLI